MIHCKTIIFVQSDISVMIMVFLQVAKFSNQIHAFDFDSGVWTLIRAAVCNYCVYSLQSSSLITVTNQSRGML